METAPQVPWPNVAAFVRQHTHDVRNHLNGIDLEAALLRELVTDPEALQGVARLRQQVRDIAAELRGISNRLAEPSPRPTAIAAAELFEIWQDQVAVIRDPPCEIEWRSEVNGETLLIDPTLVSGALLELVQNALHFHERPPGVVICSALRVGTNVEFLVQEGKASPPNYSTWGKTPLQTTRRGALGLGLWNAQRVFALSEGQIERRYDDTDHQLITVARLPHQST